MPRDAAQVPELPLQRSGIGDERRQIDQPLEERTGADVNLDDHEIRPLPFGNQLLDATEFPPCGIPDLSSDQSLDV